jgi:molecular chaperone DnaK
LSESAIEQMRKDAELHAEEDKQKRQLAELRNQADTMCFQLEKLMKEHADKIKDSDRTPLEAAIKKTREVAKGSDAEAMKSAIGELEQASHALSKTLYETGKTATGGPAGSPGDGAAGGAAKSGDDDAIDAEFEVKE